MATGAAGGQAACESTGRGSGTVLAPWTCASTSLAASRQLPQFAPTPVRMVSSDTLWQPASATSRIWRSVTPWQRQTYTVDAGPVGNPRSFAANENDCQSPDSNAPGRHWNPDPGPQP